MARPELLPSLEEPHLASKGEHIHFQFYHYQVGPRPSLVSGCLSWTPPIDLYETQKEIVLEVDLAGVKPENIQFHLSGQILKLVGIREDTSGIGTRCYEIMEIERGSFERIVELPKKVAEEKISAEYHDGVLVLRMMKLDDEDLQ